MYQQIIISQSIPFYFHMNKQKSIRSHSRSPPQPISKNSRRLRSGRAYPIQKPGKASLTQSSTILQQGRIRKSSKMLRSGKKYPATEQIQPPTIGNLIPSASQFIQIQDSHLPDLPLIQNESDPHIPFVSQVGDDRRPPSQPINRRNRVGLIPRTRTRRSRIFNETIIISDDSDPDDNQAIQNQKLWFLDRNKQYHYGQLTIKQLEKCDQCGICYQDFFPSQEKTEKDAKTEIGIKTNVEQRKIERMIFQREQRHTEVMELFCGHFYHKICIIKWLLSSKPYCPFCRKDFRRHDAYKQKNHEYPNLLRSFNISEDMPLAPFIDLSMFENYNEQVVSIEDFRVNQSIVRPVEIQIHEDQCQEVVEIPVRQKRYQIIQFILPGWTEQPQKKQYQNQQILERQIE